MQRGRRLLVFCAFLALTLFALGACAPKAAPTASTEVATTVAETTTKETPSTEETVAGLKGKKVAHLALGTQTPYCMPLLETARKGLEAVGVEVVLFDAKFDAALQATQMDDAIAMKPDLIILWPLDVKAMSPGIKKAFDAGIPILVDNNQVLPEDEKYTVAYVGPNNYLEGVAAAELMNEALGGKGKIGMIEGAPGQEAQIQRAKGFEDRLKELNSQIEIVARQTANWVKADATKVMEDWLVRFPDLDGVYAQDDTMAVGAWIAMQEAGVKPGSIKIVGVGGSKEGLKAIDDGVMYGTVLQSPVTEGKLVAEKAIEILRKGLKAGDQLEPYLNFQEMPKITKENVAQYLPGEW